MDLKCGTFVAVLTNGKHITATGMFGNINEFHEMVVSHLN